MSDVAITVHDLWKKYRIGKPKSVSFRESLSDILTSREDTFFWALREIQFQVKKGEAVGIIGFNGAGKSTLLKILSRITFPTKGRIEINGRVSSLLEVGTGFHPELTGRQNIMLNGTILGMKRAEVNEKLDEIIDFSGIEKFVDTPVKHYSSGMKVRLAFSVAAHLEPEILIIDEVLAVGDADFQKKCLGKMQDVAGSGRTVLFVSHNMAAVKNLCNRGILIEKGKITYNNTASLAISRYESSVFQELNQINNFDNLSRKGDLMIKFQQVVFHNTIIKYDQDIEFDVYLEKYEIQNYSNIELAVNIKNSQGVVMIHACNKFIEKELEFQRNEESYHFKLKHNLRPGKYLLTLFIRANGVIKDWIENACYFTISESSPFPYSNLSEIQGLNFSEYQIERNTNDI